MLNWSEKKKVFSHLIYSTTSDNVFLISGITANKVALGKHTKLVFGSSSSTKQKKPWKLILGLFAAFISISVHSANYFTEKYFHGLYCISTNGTVLYYQDLRRNHGRKSSIICYPVLYHTTKRHALPCWQGVSSYIVGRNSMNLYIYARPSRAFWAPCRKFRVFSLLGLPKTSSGVPNSSITPSAM